MRVLQIIFGAGGLFSLVYFIIIISYAGWMKGFSPFWLAAALFALGAAGLLWQMQKKGRLLPRWAVGAIGTVLAAGLLLFLFVLILILTTACKKPKPDADYVVVLGTQVKGTRITKSLRYRLDAAYDYLLENPRTAVIVSGGQGSGEDISEAEAMERYLIERGIDGERIIQENRSTSTVENIVFSSEYMKPGEKSVVIVTNGFHVFRGIRIAEKQQLGDISGLGGKSDKILAVSMYVREVMAVIKDFLFGNL